MPEAGDSTNTARSTPTEVRLQLLHAGFAPLPIMGKKPPFDEWSKKIDSNADEIALWGKLFAYAASTGVLTKFTPALDIDILEQEAAEAVEALVRERFEEGGYILVRIGRPPKRAIPFRTDAPFKKLAINLIAPNGSEGQKLELLCNGQQLVAFGIHQDTGKPYTWHGGKPGVIKREELPYLDEAAARQLIEDAAEILCKDFGYKRGPARPGKGNGTDDDIDNGVAAADWGHLADNVRVGRELHDSLRDLAAKLVASGMGAGAAVNFIRGLMDASTVEHDKRWKTRYDDIPRLVHSAQSKQEKPKALAVAPCTLIEVREKFCHWFGPDHDMATLDVMLAVAAAEKLPGDPAWLLIISGPGNAKTETVQANSKLPAQVVSTLTSEAALLSASPRKQRAKTATGGLLKQIGERGTLVIKDVTSILSMHREMRSAILAALREIYDGHWVRNVGSDGGQTLEWKGRIVVIGACTTAWDQAHSVIAVMGDRFVIIRSDSHKGRVKGGLRAMRNTGDEIKMREELATAVAGLVNNIDTNNIYRLGEDDENIIVKAADIVTLARTGVEQDYRGDVIDAHAPEMPTRFAKQLTQIMRGAIAIGMARLEALKLVIRCARDSMPPLRLAVLRYVAAHPDAPVIDVRRRLQKPRATIDRALQALHILGLLTCREEEEARGESKIYHRHYSLAAGVDLAVLDDPTDEPRLAVDEEF